jgi:hypothetical protein
MHSHIGIWTTLPHTVTAPAVQRHCINYANNETQCYQSQKVALYLKQVSAMLRYLCFKDKKKKIEAFKSKDLALFTLFNVDRRDAVALTSIMEKIDPAFTRIGNAVDFSNTCCQEYKETFLFLYRLFFDLIVPKKVQFEAAIKPISEEDSDEDEIDEIATGSVAEESEVSKVEILDTVPAVTMETAQYHYLLSFLMIFMALPPGSLQTWLFWLVYSSKEKQPDHKSLEDLIRTLWPDDKKTKKKVQSLMKQAQNMLIIVDVADLTPSKLRALDANTGGAWTRPLMMLQKRIRQSTLGYFFWKRVAPEIWLACENLEDSYEKLKDPYKLSKWGKRNKALTGEIRAARKEIRVLVRTHMTYLDLSSKFSGSEISGSRRGSNATSVRSTGTTAEQEEEEEESVVHYLYVKLSAPFRVLYRGASAVAVRSAKVLPSIGSSGGGGGAPSGRMSAKSGRSTKAKSAGGAGGFMARGVEQLRRMSIAATGGTRVTQQQQEEAHELVNLEEKYKESLGVPVEVIYGRVATAQQRAEMMMAQCDREPRLDDVRRRGGEGEDYSGSSRSGSGSYSDSELDDRDSYRGGNGTDSLDDGIHTYQGTASIDGYSAYSAKSLNSDSVGPRMVKYASSAPAGIDEYGYGDDDDDEDSRGSSGFGERVEYNEEENYQPKSILKKPSGR